ncbi:hypothetical protein D3C71_2016320 [compost metagenome]
MFKSSTMANGSSSAMNSAVSCSGTRPRTKASSNAALLGRSDSLAVVGNSVLEKVGALAP